MPALGWTDERAAKPIHATAAGVRRARLPGSRPHAWTQGWGRSDGAAMTLLRRAPREVYGVYGEEEYLEGLEHEPLAGDEGEHFGEHHAVAAGGPAPNEGARAGRRRRVVALAALAAGVCAVGVVAAASKHAAVTAVDPGQVAARRGPAARMSLPQRPRAERAGAPARRRAVRRVRVTRARPPRERRSTRTPETAIPVRPRLIGDTATPSESARVVDSARAAQPTEFGFER
jgi:hypothetical protein